MQHHQISRGRRLMCSVEQLVHLVASSDRLRPPSETPVHRRGRPWAPVPQCGMTCEMLGGVHGAMLLYAYCSDLRSWCFKTGSPLCPFLDLAVPGTRRSEMIDEGHLPQRL